MSWIRNTAKNTHRHGFIETESGFLFTVLILLLLWIYNSVPADEDDAQVHKRIEILPVDEVAAMVQTFYQVLLIKN